MKTILMMLAVVSIVAVPLTSCAQRPDGTKTFASMSGKEWVTDVGMPGVKLIIDAKTAHSVQPTNPPANDEKSDKPWWSAFLPF